MFSVALKPIGVPRGAYAEQHRPLGDRVERFCARLIGPMARRLRARRLSCDRFLQAVVAESSSLQNISADQLRALANDLRTQLCRCGCQPQVFARAFALVREAATQALGMRHFDVQVIGGWILLNGMIAEMDTGEGKTLTATLPAATMALAGFPVHVVTVNDYLAQRDAQLMLPLYQTLGLSVGVVTSGMSIETRRQAYARDITYCTNKELVFDYLRDRLALGRTPSRMHLQVARLAAPSHRTQLLLRGLHFAIVDEADSILVDEARTPLIISSQSNENLHRQTYQAALALAAELELGHDFVIEARDRVMQLTDSGRLRLVELGRHFQLSGYSRWRREELVRQALTALHLMHRDAHYLVKDDKIQIIDEYTGRVMADRSWEHGLQQLIELKEGCAVTRQNDPLSRISYQRFFRRYRRLAGMTGTAREVSGEFWSVYGLAVVTVPTHHLRRRVNLGSYVYPTIESKWQAVLSRVTELRAQERPVLIGTRSVAASEQLSRVLSAAAIPHQVLNARHDEKEAAIIARAGEPGTITVATNMAGRGTDIRLSPVVAQGRGLHVIGTERHDARRIDRQLWGRCGRQGDPGSYELIVSLEDDLIAPYVRSAKSLVDAALNRYHRIGQWLAKAILYWGQRNAERVHSRTRRELLNHEEHLERALGFSGSFE
jgi:preprotein translocase subunit SecA